MATQLTIVNNILARLREDTVSSVVDNAYSQLIARFVNDAKEDMEDINHEWSVYIQSLDTTILADGTRTYELADTTGRSWLMRQKEDRLPMAFDVTSGQKGQLYDIPYKKLLEVRAMYDDSTTEARPDVFVARPSADAETWTIELLWGSTTERTWRTIWYVPQAPLSVNSNDDSETNILLPRRAIEMRALFYALEERGEVLGPREASSQWLNSTNAIAAALETDMQVQKKSDEIDFRNEESL